jgi:hypothetical protein
VVLDHIAAGVLYLLLRRRRNHDGSLISAKALLEELKDGQARAEYRKDLPVDPVKKALRRLREAGLVEYGEGKKSDSNDSSPGPPPQGYRLSVDPPIITWRATAVIVMLLYNHTERRLSREALIEANLGQGLKHDGRDEPLKAEEISELIDWSLRKGYIKEQNATIDGTSTPRTEKRLITTPKVDECELFLRKLVAEVKPQATSELPDSFSGARESQKRA